MVVFAYKKPDTDIFNSLNEYESYTDDEIAEFFRVIFSREVLLALKYLRGSSGLDKSVIEPLKNPRTMDIVENGLKWLHENQDRFPFDFMDFDPDGDDPDYVPSDSDDEDEDIFNNPEFAAAMIMEEWDMWLDNEEWDEEWDDEWDDEPPHADF